MPYTHVAHLSAPVFLSFRESSPERTLARPARNGRIHFLCEFFSICPALPMKASITQLPLRFFPCRFLQDDWKLPHQTRHILRPGAQYHCIPWNHAWLRTQQSDFLLCLVHIGNIDVPLDARVANHILGIRGRSGCDCQKGVLQGR
jgi:hypothetical protein